MSLTSFSSETAGNETDPGVQPGARSAVVVPDTGAESASPAQIPDDSFELVMDGGLETFRSEAADKGNPSSSTGSWKATTDRAQGLSFKSALKEPDNASQGGLPAFDKEVPRIEPSGTKPAQVSVYSPKTKSVSQSAPAFMRTALAPVTAGPEATVASEAVASKPLPALVAVATARASIAEPRPVERPLVLRPLVEQPLEEQRPSKEPVRESARKQSRRAKTHRSWRPHVSMQALMVTVLILGGIAEAAWIGLRVARSVSATPPPASSPAAAPPVESPAVSRPVTKTAGGTKPGAAGQSKAAAAPVRKERSVLPRLPGNSSTPVWVAISTSVPVEILEGGRRVGTSWGGGVRLLPGTHELHIINRAMAVDTHQTIEVASNTTTSLVVNLVDGRLQVKTRRPE
jgi:hypothetical protein